MLPKPIIVGVTVFGMLFGGVGTTIWIKYLYSTKAEGSDLSMGEHLFQKPFFTVFSMFIYYIPNLLIHYLSLRSEPVLPAPSARPSPENTPPLSYKDLSVIGLCKRCAVLAFCDFWIVFERIGLTLTSASVYQMMKGAEVLFTAIFSVFYLKKPLPLSKRFGVGCVMYIIFLKLFDMVRF